MWGELTPGPFGTGPQGPTGPAGPVAPPVVQTTTLTGTQNDLVLTAGVSLLRCNNASLLTITGLAAGIDGQRVTIESVGAGQVDFPHQNTGSAAANRLVNFATSGPASLAAGVGSALYVYDATTQRWRLILHNQAAMIAVPYNAANFGGVSAMTWTVDAGDQTVFQFLLDGSMLTVSALLDATSVGGTPSNTLLLTIPNGFTCKTRTQATMPAFDNSGSTSIIALVDVGAGANRIGINRADLTPWQVSTNLTYVRVNITFPVN